MSERGTVEVSYVAGDEFLLHVRGHEIVVDQPAGDGGRDAGPTPTELFVGSLVSCIGFYAERFLRRNGVDIGGLSVAASYTLSAKRPARVETIELTVTVPGGIPARLLPATKKVVEGCTIHNSLRQPPAITISVCRAITQPST